MQWFTKRKNKVLHFSWLYGSGIDTSWSSILLDAWVNLGGYKSNILISLSCWGTTTKNVESWTLQIKKCRLWSTRQQSTFEFIRIQAVGWAKSTCRMRHRRLCPSSHKCGEGHRRGRCKPWQLLSFVSWTQGSRCPLCHTSWGCLTIIPVCLSRR